MPVADGPALARVLGAALIAGCTSAAARSAAVVELSAAGSASEPVLVVVLTDGNGEPARAGARRARLEGSDDAVRWVATAELVADGTGFRVKLSLDLESSDGAPHGFGYFGLGLHIGGSTRRLDGRGVGGSFREKAPRIHGALADPVEVVANPGSPAHLERLAPRAELEPYPLGLEVTMDVTTSRELLDGSFAEMAVGTVVLTLSEKEPPVVRFEPPRSGAATSP